VHFPNLISFAKELLPLTIHFYILTGDLALAAIFWEGNICLIETKLSALIVIYVNSLLKFFQLNIHMLYYAWYKHFAEAPQVCKCLAAGKMQVAISIQNKQNQTILYVQ